MVIWRITGNEIGPNGNGAAHFSTKAEAERAVRDWLDTFDKNDEEGRDSQGPYTIEKIVIRNREDLAWHLNEAMGYGAS